jgi:hypothetical protein
MRAHTDTIDAPARDLAAGPSPADALEELVTVLDDPGAIHPGLAGLVRASARGLLRAQASHSEN